MSCEVFDKNRCTGCEGLSPKCDIDELKRFCEHYKSVMLFEEGEQMKIGKENGE